MNPRQQAMAKERVEDALKRCQDAVAMLRELEKNLPSGVGEEFDEKFGLAADEVKRVERAIRHALATTGW